MNPEQGTILDVYNALLAGRTLQMTFITPDAAEKFRVQMHQYKTQQEQIIKGLEMEWAPTSFSFLRQTIFSQDFDVVFILSFKTKVPQKTYTFVDVTQRALYDPTIHE